MLRVTFTDEEWARESAIADERYRVKREYNVRDRRITRRKDSRRINLEGMLSELAVAKVLDLLGSKSTDASICGDGGIGDLAMPSGETISVKLNGMHGGDFALRSNDVTEFADDYGVLVYPLKPNNLRAGMVVVGYITRQRFEKECIEKDYGYGPRLVVEPEDLSPIEELRDKVRTQRGGTTHGRGTDIAAGD